MVKQFASRLSLIAFATVSARGLLTASDFYGTIQTGLIAACVLYGVGLAVGEVARRVVEENVQAEFARINSENTQTKP